MAVSLAMVTLNDNPAIRLPDIFEYLQTTWRGIPASEPDQRGSVLTFNVGTANVFLAPMPAPIPWAELEGPCETSLLFPDAEAALKPHTHHMIVTVLTDGPPVERALLLTKVVAAVLATCDAATGVYWALAGMVIRPDVFREFAVKILPPALPLEIWVDFRVAGNPDGTSSGFTVGLAMFELMDIETQNATERPSELRDRLISIAHYLIENGLVIGDGHTIGEGADQEIRVVYADSAFGNSDRIMRLDYLSPRSTQKRPWWKLH